MGFARTHLAEMCQHSDDTWPSYCKRVLFLGMRCDRLTPLDTSRRCVAATLSAYNVPTFPNPQNTPSLGYLHPHLIHDSFGPFESAPQTTSRWVQPFVQGWRTLPTDRPSDRQTLQTTLLCACVAICRYR